VCHRCRSDKAGGCNHPERRRLHGYSPLVKRPLPSQRDRWRRYSKQAAARFRYPNDDLL
jgi:hypothetical protein